MKLTDLVALVLLTVALAAVVYIIAVPSFARNLAQDCLSRGDIKQECITNAWSGAVNEKKSPKEL